MHNLKAMGRTRLALSAAGSMAVLLLAGFGGDSATASPASSAPASAGLRPQARYLLPNGVQFARVSRFRVDRAGLGWRGAAASGESVALDGLPGIPGTNPKTNTIYVPVNSGHSVDVINAARCNAHVRSGCRVVGKAPAGSQPGYAVADRRTDTIYVVNVNEIGRHT